MAEQECLLQGNGKMWKLKGQVIYLGVTAEVAPVKMGCSHQIKRLYCCVDLENETTSLSQQRCVLLV